VVEDVESMSLTEVVEDDVRLATADTPGDGVYDAAITPAVEVALAATEKETTRSAVVTLVGDIATAEEIGKSDVDCAPGKNGGSVTGVRYVSFDDEVVATGSDLVELAFSEGTIGRPDTNEEVLTVLENDTEEAVFVSLLAVVTVVFKRIVDPRKASGADVEIMLVITELLSELKLPEDGVLDNTDVWYVVDREESTPGAAANVTFLSVEEVITVDI